MKNYFTIILLLVAAIMSCKKDSDKPNETIVGFWKGTYTNPNDNAVKDMAFLFRENGTLRLYDMQHASDTANANIVEGTYSIAGNNVSGTIPQLSYNISATVDMPKKVMSGRVSSSGAVVAQFSLEKIN